jgi:UDP-glucose 4-epimerase
MDSIKARGKKLGIRNMRVLVTGCGGFIGSNLTDHLLEKGHEVLGYDNFSTGQISFLKSAQKSSRFSLVQDDILNLNSLTQAMKGCEFVYHLAANADVRFGLAHPRKDLEQNTIATFNVLEGMRANGIRRIAFSSTGSIYGEPDIFPTPENAPFPVQTSLYGASKMAAEALIEAYCEGFGFQGYLFRFVSILGERYSHGHVFDFYKSLRNNPEELRVLGDGHQKKSYLYVRDCLEAMDIAIDTAADKVNIFNLGTDEYCEVNDSIGWITEHLHLHPKLLYAGGKRGWVGDSPFILLDCRKIRSRGWKPKQSIREGVIRTLQYLQENAWLLEGR